MPGRTRAAQEGQRIAHRVSGETADELRNARLTSGLTQAQVGTAMGVDRERISAVEPRKPKAMTIDQIANQGAVLGLRLSIKLYPLGDPMRDVAQVRYITSFVGRIGTAWKIRLDVPLPLTGDLRAIDVVLVGVCVIAVEIVTQLRDVQAIIRVGQLKQRDFGATRLVIVVAGTHANRRAVAEARTALGTAFDLDTQRVMRALAEGKDPGRDAIVVL